MVIKKVNDFSKWNEIKDYNLVSKAIDGSIIRCGYRGNKTRKLTMDDTYIEKITELNKRKVPVGIYFFSTAITELEAREEAVFAVKLAENLHIDLSFPIMIDTEYCNKEHNGRSDKLSKSDRTNIILSFIDQCNDMGYEAAIYASESWFTNQLDYNKIKNIKKWVAKYGSKPKTIDNMIGWQKTSSATCSGVNGRVDESEWYVDINKAAALYTVPVTESKNETPQKELKEGEEVTLNDCPLYSSSASNKVVKKISGKYYIWSAKKILNRIRITTSEKNVGVASKITGWICIDDIK